jgi:hypothetical protein
LTGGARERSVSERRKGREGRRRRREVGTSPKVPPRWIFELL